jgi:hypothetical protein
MRPEPQKSPKKVKDPKKWFFANFRLETVIAQFLPTTTGYGDFSDFSKNFRGCMGGGGPEITILIVILIIISKANLEN